MTSRAIHDQRSGTAQAWSPDPILEATSLYRFFRSGEEETLALRGVSMTLRAGEMVAVVGPSGSGKSTLLACLAGLDEPGGGSVRVAGDRMSHRSEQTRARLRANRIGLLFQNRNMLGHLTILQNVALAQQFATRTSSALAPGVVLDSLGIADRGRAYPNQLSGGELARAGLAVAVANDPLVLLADEPTGELDTATERIVLDILRRRADDGTAILIASHSPAVAAAADRIIALADGLVVS